MNTLFVTILVAIVIMAFVVLGFAVGRLITGKNKLRKGCGWTPKDKNSKGCDMCGRSEPCEKENDDSGNDTRDDHKED